MSKIDNFKMMHEATQNSYKELFVELLLSDDFDEHEIVKSIKFIRSLFDYDKITLE